MGFLPENGGVRPDHHSVGLTRANQDGRPLSLVSGTYRGETRVGTGCDPEGSPGFSGAAILGVSTTGGDHRDGKERDARP
jgi:hypothetical protein